MKKFGFRTFGRKMAAILFGSKNKPNILHPTSKTFGFRMDSDFEWSEFRTPTVSVFFHCIPIVKTTKLPNKKYLLESYVVCIRL